MQFPTRVELDATVAPLHLGLTGLVEGVCASVVAQGGALDVDEALVASTASFSHYGFDRDLNLYAEDDTGCGEGVYFSNFGGLESLGYFTGWHGRDINGASDTDLWNLVRYEISGGRPLVSVGFGLEGPVVLTGFAESPGHHDVKVTNGRRTEVFNLLTGKPQGASETFVNFVIPVRRGDPGILATERQAVGVLGWAVKHAQGQKEFLHETRENYRPGIAGLVRLAEHATMQPTLARGYRAASQVLPRWGEWLGTSLSEAADGFGLLAHVLDGHGQETVETASRQAYAALARAVERIEPHAP